MTTAEKYVTAAYCAIFAVVLVYVAIIALKLQRLEREVDELVERTEAAEEPSTSRCPLAELLFWPALLLYGEAAVGYFGDARTPASPACGDVGRPPRLAAADRAPRGAGGARERLPVGDVGGLAQPLRLARGRGVSDLGLPRRVPAARSRRHADRCGAAHRRACRRGTAIGTRSHYSNLFLVLHVVLVLVAFAGFTLASALSALYLWQERRLKRRATTILRRPAPSLATLDRLAARTVAFSLPPLTLGIVVGLVRLVRDGDHLDALVIATLVTWAAWVAYLVLR